MGATRYDRVLVMGDSNLEPSDMSVQLFMDTRDLKCLLKNKTCHKSQSGSCINLILTNCANNFKHTLTLETGLSDFHLMIYSMLKTTYLKIPPKRIIYRNYKKLS